MAQADRDTFDDWANKKAASTSAGLASAFGADDGRKKAPDKNNKQKCNKPSNIIISIDSSPSTNGDDDEVEIIEGKEDHISDEVYTTAVRVQIRQLLELKDVPTNPNTFSRESMKTNMADKLISHKVYLLLKANNIDEQNNLKGFMFDSIKDIIPEKGGGRAKGGMKVNVSKTEMIHICVDAWG